MQKRTKHSIAVSAVLAIGMVGISPQAEAGWLKKTFKKAVNVVTTGKASGKKKKKGSFKLNQRAVAMHTTLDACPTTAVHEVLKMKGWNILRRGKGVSDGFARAKATGQSMLVCEYKSKLKMSKNICNKGYGLNGRGFLPKPNKKSKNCLALKREIAGYSAADIQSIGKSSCKSHFGNSAIASYKYKSIDQSSYVIKADIVCKGPK